MARLAVVAALALVAGAAAEPRKLLQANNADLASANNNNEGTVNPTHLAQVHANNQNYEAQKQALTNAFNAQQQTLQQELAQAPAGSPAAEQIQEQITTSQNTYLQNQAALKHQVISENTNANAWVNNVDWAAVPWPSQQAPSN